MRDDILESLEEQAKLHERKAKRLRKNMRNRRNFLERNREFNELINRLKVDVDPYAYAKKHNLNPETVLAKRHKVENLFAKLKDWRRITMRYDRCPNLFKSAIYIAATVIFWI